MLTKDVLSLLGLCARARKLSSGSVLFQDIRTRQAKLVLLANDASDNTIKKVNDKCHFYGIECIKVGDSSTLSQAIGKDNRVALAILDKGFADKIKSKLGG